MSRLSTIAPGTKPAGTAPLEAADRRDPAETGRRAADDSGDAGSSRPQPQTVRLRRPVTVRSAASTIVAVLVSILVLQYAQGVLIPIVLGVLISYALDPIVTALGRVHVPRPLAAAVVLAALVVGGGALVYNLRFEAAAIVEKLPQAARRVRQMLESNRPSAQSPIQQVQKAATELERAASAAVPPPPASGVSRVQVVEPFDVSQYLVWGSLGIATALGQLVLMVFLVFFLLASGSLGKRKLVKIAGPSLTEKKVTLEILSEIDSQIARFLFIQLFTSTVVGTTTWLAFRAFGLEQAALWGVLAGVFNSIPYLGPVVVTGSSALIALVQFGDLRKALLVAGVAFAITTLEGLLLTPWLASRTARMNAVAIFVGLLFWGWVWGVWGMLLAVPMLMVLKAICDRIEDFKSVGELLGE